MFHKKYLGRYLIVSVVLAVLLFALEYWGGTAIGIIHLGGGGECECYLTLGGCCVTTLYPMSRGDDPHPPRQQQIVSSHPILLIVTFILRFVIVIPLTNLIFCDKDDFDYTEELQAYQKKTKKSTY